MKYENYFFASFAFLVILLSLLVISDDFLKKSFAQYPDISQIGSNKFVLTVDEKTYDLFYGFHGSLDSIGSNYVFPTVNSVVINTERKSLEISMDEVTETTDFWIRIPEDVLYAENEKFQVIVDGNKIQNDLIKFPNDYVVGFLLPENSTNIEIIGTKIIPEFGGISIMILGLSFLGLIYFVSKKSLFQRFNF